MTLVERLRALTDIDSPRWLNLRKNVEDDILAAADEIERLNGQVEALTKAMGKLVEESTAEIERLQKLVTEV